MSAQARYEALNRPWRGRVTLPAATIIRMEGIALDRGMTVSQAIGQAAGQWSVWQERTVNRQRRLELDRALRQAMDLKPIEEVLAELRR